MVIVLRELAGELLMQGSLFPYNAVLEYIYRYTLFVHNIYVYIYRSYANVLLTEESCLLFFLLLFLISTVLTDDCFSRPIER